MTAHAEISEGDKLFTLKIKPIFAEKCNGCHGDDADKVKGDFNMLTREQLLKGGETIGSDVMVIGDASKSFLIESIKWEDPDFEMPPKENDRLTAEQIALVEEWINIGAPWPNDELQSEIVIAEAKTEVTDEGIIVKTSGGLGDDWTYRRYKPEDIWGFLPVEKPEIDLGDQNPIDYFVGDELDKSGFKAATKADPRILIRRATFDLIGMPPTPREVYEFGLAYEKNPKKAWSDLIDRLLESKHYGERWAQHWLDVARYADTAGFSNDYERSNMWRYRDYVIRSLNNDKPYDQFIVEQVAGDELADNSLRSRIKDWDKYQKAREDGDQYNEQESEWLIASSFLRQGPWDPAMVKAPQARQLYIDDVVNGVGQTFLATTMRCFKCHDHKFDPLPTRDYYSMYTAFAATQLSERNVPFLGGENQDGFEESEALTQQLHQFAQERTKSLTAKREEAARAWYRDNGKEYVAHADRKNLPDEEKPPRHVGLTQEEQGKLKVREQDAWIWNRRLERYEPMVQTVYNGPDPSFLNARKMRMNAKANNQWRPTSKILTGGALEAPGDDVEAGVLSAVGVPTEITDELDGRRLGVAKWIADPNNQLTTRSIVNRIWQYHFGKAIAGNPNNFGVKGEKPTHPQLLDWLAADFVENGWTFKRLHKMIMMSDVYQQSGKHPQLKELVIKDPNNDLFAYFPSRRLSAEELR
ncbi:MAG: PSD1 and planctomycete cytochrome C domain-containing protein, partial [Verrucomicrobiota bacterium]